VRPCAYKDYKPSGNTYEIKSFENLVNIITPENCAQFGADFIKWATYVSLICEQIRKEGSAADKKKSNWQLLQPSFVWVDDGKNEMEKVQLKIKGTGEVRTITIKKDEQ